MCLIEMSLIVLRVKGDLDNDRQILNLNTNMF